MLNVIAIGKNGFAMQTVSDVSNIAYNKTDEYFTITYGNNLTVTFTAKNWLLVIEPIEITV